MKTESYPDAILTLFEMNPDAKCIVKYSTGEWMMNDTTTNISLCADGTWVENQYYKYGNWSFVRKDQVDMREVDMLQWKQCKFIRPEIYSECFY